MNRQAGSNLSDKLFNIVIASNTHFPSHIHYVYEVFCVKKGTATAIIDGTEYILQAGDGLVVFPLQYHSYMVDKDSKIEVYVFSPHFISEFDELVAGKKPLFPKFCASDIPSPPGDTSKILCMKAFFYDLCHRLLSRIQLTNSEGSGNILSVLDKLFLFVDKNYDKSCTLSDAAAFLKYDYTYLSKLFKCKTGMSYNEYVNHFRIGRATYLLFDKDRSISEVAFEVGYNSIRTFNWEFQKIMHATPVAYRSGLPQ